MISLNRIIHKNEIILYHTEIDNLDPYELSILSAIKIILTNQYDCKSIYCPVNVKDVINILSNNNIIADKTKRHLNKSFKALLTKNILEYNKKSGSTYHINRHNLLFKKEMFVSINNKDLQNILCDLNSNSIKLYGCYIKLLSTININTKFSYPSLECLSEKFNMSIMTTQKYTKLLEQNNLISIYRQKSYDSQTGKFRSYNNIYFKPSDAEFISKQYNINLQQTTK